MRQVALGIVGFCGVMMVYLFSPAAGVTALIAGYAFVIARHMKNRGRRQASFSSRLA
jgi:hypothetical protein